MLRRKEGASHPHLAHIQHHSATRWPRLPFRLALALVVVVDLATPPSGLLCAASKLMHHTKNKAREQRLAEIHKTCEPKVLFIKSKKAAGSTIAAVLQAIAIAKNWCVSMPVMCSVSCL